MAQTTKRPARRRQPKRFIERIFELEQGSVGKAIEFAHQLERKREPGAQASLHEREEVGLDERALQAAVERPVQEGSESIPDTAVEKTKGAGHVISEAASKAKAPLIVGGTALVGAAAGAVVRDRFGTKRSKNPLNRLRGVSLPGRRPS